MKTTIFILQYLLVDLCYGAKIYNSKDQECSASELPPDPSSQCCGVDVTVTNRIIGGEPTALRQYPWLALVEYSSRYNIGKSPQLFCGAFLISARYVVTAAHCVSDSLDDDWKATGVRLGEYDKTHPGKDCVSLPSGKDCTTAISIPIEKVMAHEHYVFSGTSIKNDIALIKLKDLAPYTDHIRPVCLPPTDFTTKPPPSLKLHVAGWGTMKQIKKPGVYNGYKNIDSKVKQHVKLPFISYQKCRRSQRLVTKSHICAGGNGKDSCMGDSGGPLMFNRDGVYEPVGIVSYGPGAPCGMRGVPGVYTKVFDFKEWIMQHIDG